MFTKLNLRNQKFLIFLIVLDLFMTASAIFVDWSDFFSVPWYLIPFVSICPLYPLLLAIVFWKFRRKGSFSQPLLHFTLMGIIGYGIMAYIFYPTFFVTRGFGWYELGNIFWVTIYASQALLLIPYVKKIAFSWYIPFFSYFIVKDILDRFGGTFSYQRFEVFSTATSNFLFIMILSLHLFAGIFLMFLERRNSKYI